MKKLGIAVEDLSSWQGKWIYFAYEQGHSYDYLNAWRRFRKTYILSSDEVIKAEIKISGETRYKLWINGVYVARGPAKGYPEYQPYDRIDIKKYLKPGKNSFAVLLSVSGISTTSSIWRHRAGIIVDGEITFQNGKKQRVDSDTTWKVITDPARTREGKRLSNHLFFQEIFIAEKDESSWTLPEYNDKKWFSTEILGPAGVPPWTNMEERAMPLLSENIVNFKSSTAFFAGKNHLEWKDNTKLRDIFIGEKRKVVKEGKVKTIKDNFGNITALDVEKTPKDTFYSVVLDLGKISVGCPRLKIKALGGEYIDFYYTARSPKEPFYIFKNWKDYSRALFFDRYICGKGAQEFETFHFKGARYLTLVFRNINKPIKIEKIDFNFVAYPVKPTGKFECSDSELNYIWKTGEWTLRCCMLDSYVDCPDREQGQWMGDALVEEEVNFYSFADKPLMKRMLRQCAQSQLSNGIMYGAFPTDQHQFILPDYNFTWLLAAEKFYDYTGDVEILKEIYPSAVKNLEWFEKNLIKEYGMLGNPDGYWLFVDWAPIDKSGICASYNLWYLIALRSMQKIAKLSGKSPAVYAKREKKLKAALLKTFYDRKKGLWYEAFDLKKKKTVQVSQHANTLACLANLPIGAGTKKVIKDSFLKKSTKKMPRASSYFASYVLQALFKIGEQGLAVNLIKKGWGGMIKRGATTFWEIWGALDQPWSVCHAWSAHPVMHLSKYILGVKCTGTAWKNIEFDPKPVKGVKWARGIVPTPYGNITAEWKRNENGKLEYSLDCPEGVKCVKFPKRNI
ncbi:MAG: hypothetical protein A2231_08830 [Candidatus Firestonebacteria bacterium RIFOXYA2_FULL_40_8]|nr:MAG: hypothetical protein A2231_08830 [Candidatus Firestonebacteria bacterium RIFOXYA2_FULL_40_8]